ncbi:hypothetical protein FHU33_1172 [Blastococcus colisei]|uniref:Uncharacterized protein n=1 Tax=Blastococcus colisei TaxID=1564162 RepID=A0A543PCI5_9ACTN|nr:hypothetical protein FHU33_1172 [Blastococcus colisei]
MGFHRPLRVADRAVRVHRCRSGKHRRARAPGAGATAGSMRVVYWTAMPTVGAIAIATLIIT